VNRTLQSLVIVCLTLVAALVVLSAYIRLNHVGLGCAEWPACYGRIGTLKAHPAGRSTADTVSAYQQLVNEKHAPQGWAATAHRLIASLLGIGIIALTVASLIRRRKGAPVLIPLLLLALTVFLAVLGNWSGGLHRPAVVLGNLFGGFGMLVLLWLLWLRTRRYAGGGYATPRTLHGWISVGLLVLSAQILLGSLTSANFAALACSRFPTCDGTWLPGPAIATAFDILRVLPVNAAGVVSGGEETQAIHSAHRLGAWITLLILGWTATLAIRTGGIYRDSGITVLLLLLAEILIGVSAVFTGIPIALATAHNALAALLLLTLLTLQHKTRTASLGNSWQ
jgi:heme a synthase